MLVFRGSLNIITRFSLQSYYTEEGDIFSYDSYESKNYYDAKELSLFDYDLLVNGYYIQQEKRHPFGFNRSIEIL